MVVRGERLPLGLAEVDLSIPLEDRTAMADIFAVSPEGITDEPALEVVERARMYAHSPGKRKLERVFAKFLMHAGLGVIEWASVRAVHGGNSKDGWYQMEVGFPGLTQRFAIRKLRTMRPGADQEFLSPFQHTAFVAGRSGYDHDERIINRRAKLARRLGVDEIAQVEMVAEGEGRMRLLGLRAFTAAEIEGAGTLMALKKDPRLNLGGEAKKILEKYPGAARRFGPEPALISPVVAMRSKDTPIVARLAGDLNYMWRASARVDFRMATRALRQRILGVGAR